MRTSRNRQWDEQFIRTRLDWRLDCRRISQDYSRLAAPLLTSVGYEKEDNPAETTKTATLRHSLEVLLPGEYAKVENLMPEVFPLYNEFWVSFWIEDILYDKKFLFLPDSVIIEKLTLLPTFNKKGILLT